MGSVRILVPIGPDASEDLSRMEEAARHYGHDPVVRPLDYDWILVIYSEEKSNLELQDLYRSHVHLGLSGEGARIDPFISLIDR